MSDTRNNTTQYDLPTASIKRSRFERNSEHKTTFNVGEIVPFYGDPVYPGDTFDINQSTVIRTTTPLRPVMDNMYADIYYFFVPNRIIWDKWENFMGVAKKSQYDEDINNITVPTLKTAAGNVFKENSVADHMGLPLGPEHVEVNHLEIRAYVEIFNEWFRNENVGDEALQIKDSTNSTAQSGTDSLQEAIKGGKLLIANKFHDYFTNALPKPQKGTDILLPILGQAPVITGRINPDIKDTSPAVELVSNKAGGGPGQIGKWGYESSNNATYLFSDNGYLRPSNLYADLKSATAGSINGLREAFAYQKVLERDARGGSRYTEMIQAHFGVHNPDSRLQRPEYLGGKRIPLSITQVSQTAPGELNKDGLGTTGAYSLTGDQSQMFEKSFTEHGYVIGVVVVRTNHTYQSNVEKKWSKKHRTDYYLPAFQNLGEQPILNEELWHNPTGAGNKDVFGYQEYGAEYRMKLSKVTGAFAEAYGASLNQWTYADEYKSHPVLNDTWMRETTKNVDRTLAFDSTKAPQVLMDTWIKNISTRPMPTYSVPGYIDVN